MDRWKKWMAGLVALAAGVVYASHSHAAAPPAKTQAPGFYRMTLGNARALDLDDRIGSLHVGADADIVVLDSRAKPSMDLRMRVAGSLVEELFILQTMGDDRCVAETYVAGKAMKGTVRASKDAATTR